MCVVGGRPPPLADLTEVTEVTEDILPRGGASAGELQRAPEALPGAPREQKTTRWASVTKKNYQYFGGFIVSRFFVVLSPIYSDGDDIEF